MNRSLRTPSVLLALAALSAAPLARAQQPADPLARANALFDEGKQLQKDGKIAEACERYLESYRLSPRGGTLLNAGLCHEQEGKLLVARRELRDALALAKRDGRSDREPVAADHLAAVEAKLSWARIVPPKNAEASAVEVRVDDAPIPREDWARVPLMPGPHVVMASARGFKNREAKLTIAPGAPQSPTVQLEPFEAIGGEANGAVGAVGNKGPGPAAGIVKPTPHADGGHANPWKVVALVTGIVGAAASLGMGAWALERKGVVRDHCDPEKRCDDTGDSAVSTGRALVIGSTVALGVSAVGFGAWFFIPSRVGATTGQSTGITFHGTF
ncbi:MAG: tetratricopeptide repeat protein [Polyangiaceae bacterium]|nr:tetratricopeptide repeat protein [Polyangiaceae bacterium]